MCESYKNIDRMRETETEGQKDRKTGREIDRQKGTERERQRDI